MLLLLACAPPEPLTFHVERSEDDPHAITVEVSGQEEEPIVIYCETPEDLRRQHEAGTIRWLLAGRRYDCWAEISLKDFADPRTSAVVAVDVPELPDDLPIPELLDGGGGAGWLLASVAWQEPQGTEPPVRSRYFVIYDDQGRPRWHRAADAGGDVNVQMLEDGTILSGGFNGAAIPPSIMDLDGNVVWSLPTDAEGVWEVDGRRIGDWNHDVTPALDGGSVFAIAADLDLQAQEGMQGEFVIVEIGREDGELRWIWDSERDGAAWLPFDGLDPYHPNAVQSDGDVVYVSLHNLSQVIAIQKQTKQIRWTLGQGGDFALQWEDDIPEDERRWFGLQHDIKLIDGRLTVYDNHAGFGGEGAEAQTRVVELSVDEQARTATLSYVWSEQPGGDPWFTPIWGGVDPQGEGADRQYDVAAGKLHIISPDSPNSRMFRLDAQGQVVRDLQFADPEVTLYRTDSLQPYPF